MKIEINGDSCIKCGKCVKVCPAKIFEQKEVNGVVGIVYPESCIVCGHCVAVCPTNSVLHSDYPEQKVHPIDYDLLPTPEQMLLLCKARRSNRAFSKTAVPAEFLDRIVEAAHAAPTASNLQQVEFTLITDPQKLNAITDYTIGVFSSIVNRLENPILKLLLKPFLPAVYKYVPAFRRLIDQRSKGVDLVLRNATAVLFIHTPSESRFGCQDANLAYQNGSLMAETLGVSQFYTGFVCSAIKQDKKDELTKMLGIKGTIHAGMGLGMPMFKYPKYVDRKEVKITKL